MLLENPRALRDQYAKALLEDVIPGCAIRPTASAAATSTCLERDGRVFDTDKFVWLQARQVWMFSSSTTPGSHGPSS